MTGGGVLGGSASSGAISLGRRAGAGRAIAALLVVPLLVIVVAGVEVGAHGPFAASGKFDPDYNYLLNSLSILRLRSPGHTDHPGTTVQLLGAAPLLARWLGARLAGDARSLPEAVLGEPETYLRALHAGLVLVVAAASFGAGWRAATTSGALFVGVAFQLSLFLFATPLRALARVSAEPLLVAAVYLLLAALLPMAFARRESGSVGGIAVGAAVGFGLVTKATFLPLAAFVALLPDRRSRLRSAVAAAVTTAVLLIPIWKHLPRVWRWMVSLLVRSEPYGGGEAGLPSAAALGRNLAQMLANEPLLPAWLVVYLAVLAALRFGARERGATTVAAATRVLWLSCAVIVVQVALATKHFVGTHYLVPALVALALPNAVLARVLSSDVLAGTLRRALAGMAVALAVASVWQASSAVRGTMARHRSRYEAALRIAEQRTQLGECQTIGYFPSSAGNFALGFGSEYSSGVHAEVLNRLYPGTVIYQRFAGEFIGFAWVRRNRDVARTIQQGRCVLLQGAPISARELKLPSEFEMTEVLRGDDEAVYRLSLTALGQQVPRGRGGRRTNRDERALKRSAPSR